MAILKSKWYKFDRYIKGHIKIKIIKIIYFQIFLFGITMEYDIR